MTSDHTILLPRTAQDGVLQHNELENDEAIPPEAQGFVALVVTAIVLILVALTPLATRHAPMVKGWWVEPRTWPLLCLSIALIAAGFQASHWGKSYMSVSNRQAFLHKSFWAFGALGSAFEYAAYFCIYLFSVSYLGFAISSLVFMQVVIWRAGLRTWRWRMIATLFVVALVLAFRVGIQLWFPLAPVFEFTPDWFVQNIAIYL